MKYQPKIKDELIHRLYIEAKEIGKPMTKVIDEILQEHFEKKENPIKFKEVV